MGEFLFNLIIITSVLVLGILIGVQNPDKENELIKLQSSEYQKCIAELPRNQDCTLTGFVFTVTSKQD